MANKKQQKKKDREKRVPKKKHLESVKKKAQEKTNEESKQPIPARTKIMQSAVPKGDQGAKGNQKNSGFLPEERAWLDKLFDEMGFVDAFRELPQQEHEYTWWSNRGQAWANNVGWRIDYHILSPTMKGKVTATDIYRDERFSDHAPLTVDYDYAFPGE